MDLAVDEAQYMRMGPDLLSSQPLTAEPSFNQPPEWWPALYEHCESSLTSARSWRYSWWAYWSRLAEFYKPERYHWVITPNRMNRGSAINDAILDDTPTLAVNTCAAGMWAGLTNPSRKWFKFESQIPSIVVDEEGQKWLDDVAETIFATLAGSNFYTEMAQGFEDLAVFGTAPLIIYEDDEDVFRLYLPCAGEYFLKVGARLSADSLTREFTLTVEQIVEQFGLDACSQEIKALWEQGGGSLNQEFVVVHMIEPNFALTDKKGGQIKVIPYSFVYREIYWLRGEQGTQPLSIRGFNSVKPFFVMYWRKRSNDPYGRSPGMDAFGDNKQLQRQTLRLDEFLEKLIRPPMGANPELKHEPSSILPGMTTYVSSEGGKKGFYPLFEVQPTALAPMAARLEKVADRINKALFVDVFMAITQMEGVQPRNELELTKRDLERLQKLGPVIELVEGALTEAMMRIIDILVRRRLIKPKPPSLARVPIKITFESMMRLAQRSSASVAMKDVFATLGGLSSAAKAAQVPDPIRRFDLDKSAQRYAELNNYPPDCIFTDDEVAKHDAARQKAVQGAQAPQLAMAGVQAAHTLSQTALPGGDSALSAMLGAKGPGG